MHFPSLLYSLRNINQNLDMVVLVFDECLKSFFCDLGHLDLLCNHTVRVHAARRDGLEDGFEITEGVSRNCQES